jgi:hypothetical protein
MVEDPTSLTQAPAARVAWRFSTTGKMVNDLMASTFLDQACRRLQIRVGYKKFAYETFKSEQVFRKHGTKILTVDLSVRDRRPP